MTVETDLPLEVLEKLEPVLASLRAEATQAVETVAHRRVDHAGRVVVRANGTGGGYERGFEAIVADVFHGAPVPKAAPGRASVTEDIDQRTCSCTQCTDSTCDGECGTCEDYYDCSQCHNTESCCGWCSCCAYCHNVDTDSVRINNRGTAFCTGCDHFCND